MDFLRCFFFGSLPRRFLLGKKPSSPCFQNLGVFLTCENSYCTFLALDIVGALWNQRDFFSFILKPCLTSPLIHLHPPVPSPFPETLPASLGPEKWWQGGGGRRSFASFLGGQKPIFRGVFLLLYSFREGSTVDGSEILNHLKCMKPVVNNGR